MLRTRWNVSGIDVIERDGFNWMGFKDHDPVSMVRMTLYLFGDIEWIYKITLHSWYGELEMLCYIKDSIETGYVEKILEKSIIPIKNYVEKFGLRAKAILPAPGRCLRIGYWVDPKLIWSSEECDETI